MMEGRLKETDDDDSEEEEGGESLAPLPEHVQLQGFGPLQEEYEVGVALMGGDRIRVQGGCLYV